VAVLDLAMPLLTGLITAADCPRFAPDAADN